MIFRQIKYLLRRAVRIVLIVLVAIWMLFEDWVWDSILAVMEKIARLRAVQSFESFIKRQNQYFLLFLFFFPFLIMIPAKLFGLYLIANGKILRGVSIFVIAKVAITAIVTRLFIISKDKLLLIKPFASFYHWLTAKKEWLYSEVRKLKAWQKAKEIVSKIKHKLKMIIHQIRKEGQ
jgi:hypothetical protein